MANRNSEFNAPVYAPAFVVSNPATEAVQGGAAARPLFVSDWQVTSKVVASETLAGTETLVLTGDRAYAFNPDNVNRKVLLPPAATALGVTLSIANSGTQGALLLVRDSTDATTVARIANGQTYILHNDAAGGGFRVRSAIGTNGGLVSRGVPGSAVLSFATIPTTGDTVTIGADVYEFVTDGGSVANDANIGVSLGAAPSAAVAQANFILAVNGAGTGTADLLDLAGTGPCVVDDGTNAILARALDATHVQITEADAVGGNVVSGGGANGVPLSLALSEALTPAASVWTVANINVIAAIPTESRRAAIRFAVTAAMLTAAGDGIATVAFDFTPIGFNLTLLTSTGRIRNDPAAAAEIKDLFTIVGNNIQVTFDKTGVTSLIAGDLIHVEAWS